MSASEGVVERLHGVAAVWKNAGDEVMEQRVRALENNRRRRVRGCSGGG